MRIYQENEQVRLGDGSIATVKEVIRGPYKLPEGQHLGGPPTEMGGEVRYIVETDEGERKEVQDREVYNIPREGHPDAPKGSGKKSTKKNR